MVSLLTSRPAREPVADVGSHAGLPRIAPHLAPHPSPEGEAFTRTACRRAVGTNPGRAAPPPRMRATAPATADGRGEGACRESRSDLRRRQPPKRAETSPLKPPPRSPWSRAHSPSAGRPRRTLAQPARLDRRLVHGRGGLSSAAPLPVPIHLPCHDPPARPAPKCPTQRSPIPAPDDSPRAPFPQPLAWSTAPLALRPRDTPPPKAPGLARTGPRLGARLHPAPTGPFRKSPVPSGRTRSTTLPSRRSPLRISGPRGPDP